MTGRRPGSLSSRLLVSQIAVSVAMALTTAIVAAIVAPPVFEAHMRRAGDDTPEVLMHSEEALNTAGAIALAVGLVIAVSGAVLVSILITTRVRRSLTGLGRAAVRVAEGEYDLRLADDGYRELAALAESFNTTAARLGDVEATRRRLMTDLAHEMRTPLASIRTCVESLEDGAIEPGPQAWQILAGQVERIARLADDLGQVSRAEEGRLDVRRRPAELNRLAGEAILAASEAYQRKGVALALDPAPSVSAEVDAERIGQVLANLLSNALRCTPTGGRVDVRVNGDRETATIEVADTGDGIGAEHLDHVFDRFYRADVARDREHGGTGVGLTISRAIASAHAGTLTVRSGGPGTGATFTLRVPRTTPASSKLHRPG